MLRNFVQETSNAPGTSSTVNLAGAPAGRLTWASQFPSGSACYYVMSDGTQQEWGYGVYTTGTPNTVTRGVVMGNSAGTTTRLNFTGTVQIYNDVPAEKTVFQDSVGSVLIAGNTVSIASPLASGSAMQIGSTSANPAAAQVQWYGQTYGVYTRVNQNNGAFEFTNGAGTAVTLSIAQSGAITAYSTGANVFYFTNQTGVSSLQSATGGANCFVGQVLSTAGQFATWLFGASGVGSITTNGSSVAYNTTSDYRLKHVYGRVNDPNSDMPIDTGALLDAVPVYVAEMMYGAARPMILAHELQAVFPDAVRGAKDAMLLTKGTPLLDEDGAPVLDEGGGQVMTGAGLPDLDDNGVQRIDPQVVDHALLIPVMLAELQMLRKRISVLELARVL